MARSKGGIEVPHLGINMASTDGSLDGLLELADRVERVDGLRREVDLQITDQAADRYRDAWRRYRDAWRRECREVERYAITGRWLE